MPKVDREILKKQFHRYAALFGYRNRAGISPLQSRFGRKVKIVLTTLPIVTY
jgi:hypothetical protein